MISSAVVIPEPSQDTTPPPPSYSLKRRLSQSQPQSSDSKRPRVQVDELQYDEPQSQRTPPSESAQLKPSTRKDTATTNSPLQRKPSLLTGSNATEEKKRNKRLFGGLLGTLSQTTSRPAHKKRDEIEARQRERMRQQTEEEEKKRLDQKREFDGRRRNQQRLWDEEAMQQRHQNMRDMAGFLITKTEPALYYKPWDLRPQEEEAIQRQKDNVQRTIRRELGDDEEMDESLIKSGDSQSDTQSRKCSPDMPVKDQQSERRNGDSHQDDLPTNGVLKDQSTPSDGQPLPEPTTVEHMDDTPEQTTKDQDDDAPDRKEQPTALEEEEDPQKEEDHQGEELVEGQEDDVIY